MKFRPLHRWDVSPPEAIQIQEELRGKIRIAPPKRRFRIVAAADIAYSRKDDTAYAAALVFSLPDLELLEKAEAAARVSFPYIPGLLAFREGPILLNAFCRLRQEPDLLLIDGQGTAHVRSMGIAGHMGLLLDVSSIGCAKSRFIGRYGDLPGAAGSAVSLLDGDRVIGSVVRTRAGVKPVFVSPGHKIDLETSVHMILALRRGYRIPEPLRLAHLAVNRLRRERDFGEPH